MTPAEALRALLECKDLRGAEAALARLLADLTLRPGWRPVGRENNVGTIGAASDPGRSLVERVTNAIDAVLERARVERGEDEAGPCASPREAASAWLDVPPTGIGTMSRKARRALSELIDVSVTNDEGWNACIVTIADQGIGILPEDLPRTILGLNESNKVDKLHLLGAYGQGGSSTFAAARLTLIVSRSLAEPDRVAFTAVRYEDLPASRWKHGRYVYLTMSGRVPEASADDVATAPPPGVLVRHFGYDLSKHRHAVGHGSLYVLLRHVLFDPVLPFRLTAPTLRGTRTIKGARNELAQGSGDDEDTGTELVHAHPAFHVALGDHGQLEVEYWVLPAPTRSVKVPIGLYVDPFRPVLLTFNGQVHGELPVGLIRTDARRGGADLPYLAVRLVVHVRCDGLTSEARRSLFVTNREEARGGQVRAAIESEVVRILRSDPVLERLNDEARRSTVGRQDEDARRELQTEVARLLRATGSGARAPAGPRYGDAGEPGVPRSASTTSSSSPATPTAGPEASAPQLVDPPTRLDLLGPRPLELAPGQRRYVQVSTDAPSSYESAIHVHVEGDLRPCGRTSLRQGRFRLVVEAAADAAPGSSGRVAVSLPRPDPLPPLEDSIGVQIVEAPRQEPDRRTTRIPEIDCEPVEGLDDPAWTQLGWPDDVQRVASSAELEATGARSGRLIVHYSRAFPPFRRAFDALERRDPVEATSFEARYRVWLGVHSLILHRQALAREDAEGDEQQLEAERAERCRMAQVAAIVATQEVQSGATVASATEHAG